MKEHLDLDLTIHHPHMTSLKKIRILGLVNRRKQDDGITSYKALNTLASKYINEFLNERVNTKNPGGINKLYAPRV